MSLDEDMQESLQGVIEKCMAIGEAEPMVGGAEGSDAAKDLNDSDPFKDQDPITLGDPVDGASLQVPPHHPSSPNSNTNISQQSPNKKLSSQLYELQQAHDELKIELREAQQTVEDLKKMCKEKDKQMASMQEAVQSYEEDSKKMHRQLLDEKLKREEAENQVDSMQRMQTEVDRNEETFKTA